MNPSLPHPVDLYGHWFLHQNTSMPIRGRLSRSITACRLTSPLQELYFFQNDFFSDYMVEERLRQNINGLEWIDREPDLFHFRFLDVSGDFVIGDSGEITVFNCSRPNGEVSVSATLNRQSMIGNCYVFEFTIDTGDGYRYVFGGTPEACEYIQRYNYYHGGAINPDFRAANPGMLSSVLSEHITGWKLTKIIAPNGRTLELAYADRYNPEIHTDITFTPRSYYTASPSTETITYEKRTFYTSLSRPLTRVSVSDATNTMHTVIRLHHDEIPATMDDCSPACFVNSQMAYEYIQTKLAGTRRQRVVSAALVGMDGSLADSASFVQGTISGNNGARKMILYKASLLKTGEYRFGYHATTPLPLHGSGETDLWGYWDNSEEDIRSKGRGGTLENDVTWQSSSLNLQKVSSCALCKIWYPTGGYSDISYDLNRAGKLLERDGSTAPFIKEMTAPRTVGGVRVKTLRHCCGDIDNYTWYSYEDGILMDVPKFFIEMQYRREYLSSSSSQGNLFFLEGHGSPQASESGTIHSTIYGAGTSHVPSDKHIAYPVVNIIYADGSREEHRFTSAVDNGMNDLYLYYPGYTNNDFTSDVVPANTWWKDRTARLLLSPQSIRTALRGKPKSISSYDASGVLLKTVDYSYDAVADFAQYFDFNSFGFWTKRQQAYYSSSLSYESNSNYFVLDGGGHRSLTASKQIVYDYVTRQVKSESVSSGNERRTTEYTYSHETAYADRSSLKSSVSDIIRSVSKNGTAVITGKAHLGYSQVPGNRNPAPELFREYMIDTPAANGNWLSECPFRETSISYNTRYRPIHVNMPGGRYVSLTWDANDRHLLSRIVNGPVDVTSYQWSEQYGLTSVTYPSGLMARYGYDSHNRLNLISDQDADPVRKLEYLISSSGQSSITTRTYTARSGATEFTDIAFYNGLGYLFQQKSIGAAGEGISLVTPFAYDIMLRPDTRVFLPYPATDSNNAEASPIQAQALWYASHFGGDTRPFIERIYETSLAGKLLSKQRQGDAYESSGRKNRFTYELNSVSDGVLGIQYSYPQPGAEAGISISGINQDGSLLKTSTISEDGDTLSIFSDGLGKTVLNRQHCGGETLDTYFIYDLANRLVCAIQPMGTASLPTSGDISFSSDTVEKWFFTWRYDGAGNLTESHVPGGGTSHYTYDSRDRLVTFQDPDMASKGKVRFFEYDQYDRLTASGYGDTEGSGRSYLHTYSYWDEPLPSYASSGLTFQPVPGVVSEDDVDTGRCRIALAYETVGKTPVLLDGLPVQQGRITELERRHWYDAKGRVVQTLEYNPVSGFKSRHSFRYDFLGNIISEHEEHGWPVLNPVSLRSDYNYDSRGRLNSILRSMDGEAEMEERFHYDKLGRLSARIVNNGLVREDREYCIQGFITGKTTGGNMCGEGGSWLDETITYFDTPIGGIPRYDGKIGAKSTSYIMSGDTVSLTVSNTYKYDPAGRLHAAEFSMGEQVKTETRDYDLNGNTLRRILNDSEGSKSTAMTMLGNQVVSRSDNGSESSYSHDAAGRMISDRFRGLSYEYNAAGRLQYVKNQTGAVTASFAWLEDEGKYAEMGPDGAGRLYAGAFEYAWRYSPQASSPDLIRWPGGFFRKTDDGTYIAYGIISDIGGNSVSVLNLSGTTDSKDAHGAVVAQIAYLPFGQEMDILEFAADSAFRYRFSGKERQPLTEVCTPASGQIPALINYGARMYDPSLGRWLTPDPLAEKYYGISPYAYCNNSPVNLIDPDGAYIVEKDWKEWQQIKREIENEANKMQEKFDKIITRANDKGWSDRKLSRRLGELGIRLTSIRSSLGTMGVLEGSTQGYSLSHVNEGDVGGVTLDPSTKIIDISFGGTANFVHEMTHAGQFETGDVAFSNTGMSLLQDVYDETAAYKAQFGYSPSSVSGLTSTSVANSFGVITPAWVQGLKDATGSMPYAVGGSANTGLIPVNINSTRDALIQAYPWNAAAFRGLPANYNIRTLQGIYYKR